MYKNGSILRSIAYFLLGQSLRYFRLFKVSFYGFGLFKPNLQYAIITNFHIELKKNVFYDMCVLYDKVATTCGLNKPILEMDSIDQGDINTYP